MLALGDHVYGFCGLMLALMLVVSVDKEIGDSVCGFCGQKYRL